MESSTHPIIAHFSSSHLNQIQHIPLSMTINFQLNPIKNDNWNGIHCHNQSKSISKLPRAASEKLFRAVLDISCTYSPVHSFYFPGEHLDAVSSE